MIAASEDVVAEATAERAPSIVQLVRSVGTGGGVDNIASALHREFVACGYDASILTVNDMRWPSSLTRRRGRGAKLNHALETFYYSFAAPVYAGRRFPGNRVVTISHNDAMYGDVYVNHGLHRRLIFPLDQPPRYSFLVRNPLHPYLLARETLRHRLALHSYVVNNSVYSEREFLATYPYNRATLAVIPNGVDLGRFQPDISERKRVRRELRLPDDEFVLLFVGNEFERKGMRHLIDALPLLKQAQAVVVGGSAQEIARARAHAATRAVADRVTFVGKRTPDAYYRAADALVLPSIQESFPLVLLEAMACGVPCLATDVGSVASIIDHGNNGFIVAATGSAIADATRRLVDAPGLLQRVGAAAQSTASQYGWSRVAASYLKVVHAVVASRREPRVARDVR